MIRLSAALIDALAQLQAGAAPAEVAADLIKRGAEAQVLCAQLPAGDPQRAQLDALERALEARTFDESAISLEECLRDLHGEVERPHGEQQPVRAPGQQVGLDGL